MTPTAVILYGPPGAGKDTITDALIRRDSRFVRYERMKAGSGKIDDYRVVPASELARLREAGQVLYENNGYGNTYVVDELHLAALLAEARMPILHLGQIAGIEAVTCYPARWITVLLWCSRETTASRVQARGSSDVEARLIAWDETLADLRDAGDTLFSGRIETDTTEPDVAAARVHAWVEGAMSSVDGHRQ